MQEPVSNGKLTIEDLRNVMPESIQPKPFEVVEERADLREVESVAVLVMAESNMRPALNVRR